MWSFSIVLRAFQILLTVVNAAIAGHFLWKSNLRETYQYLFSLILSILYFFYAVLVLVPTFVKRYSVLMVAIIELFSSAIMLLVFLVVGHHAFADDCTGYNCAMGKAAFAMSVVQFVTFIGAFVFLVWLAVVPAKREHRLKEKGIFTRGAIALDQRLSEDVPLDEVTIALKV